MAIKRLARCWQDCGPKSGISSPCHPSTSYGTPVIIDPFGFFDALPKVAIRIVHLISSAATNCCLASGFGKGATTDLPGRQTDGQCEHEEAICRRSHVIKDLR